MRLQARRTQRRIAPCLSEVSGAKPVPAIQIVVLSARPTMAGRQTLGVIAIHIHRVRVWADSRGVARDE